MSENKAPAVLEIGGIRSVVQTTIDDRTYDGCANIYVGDLANGTRIWIGGQPSGLDLSIPQAIKLARQITESARRARNSR